MQRLASPVAHLHRENCALYSKGLQIIGETFLPYIFFQ